ncbi:MAG: PAS domain-containing sensor histidine kinase [Nitritalea sp.]
MHYLQIELERLLQSDLKLFNFIQDFALDGLWFWDLEKPEEEWMNDRFWEVLGYDPRLMPAKSDSWKTLIFPQDFEAVQKNLAAHLADSSFPFDQLVRYRHSNGSTVWVRCVGKAILDAAGKPVRLIGVHQDKTALMREKEQFYAAFHQTAAGMAFLDQKGLVQSNNSTMAAYLEKEMEGLVGKKLAANIVSVEKENAFEKGLDELLRGVLSDFSVTAFFRGTSDRPKLLQLKISRLRIVDSVTFFVLALDVTEKERSLVELKRANKLLNEAQRIGKMGAWELDTRTKKLIWSDEVYQIHEIEKGIDLQLIDGLSFYHPENRARIEKGVQDAIFLQRPYDMINRFITAKGRHLWVRSTCYPVVEGGVTVKLFGMFSDVTEQELDKRQIAKEQQFSRQVLDHMQDGFVSFTAAGAIKRVNPAFYTLSAHGIEGALEDLFIPDLFDMSGDVTKKDCLELLLKPFVGECQLISKHGERIPVLVSSGFLAAIEDEAPYFITIKDIRDLKALQAEQQRLLSKTNDQNTRLRNFAYIVTHNLRSHLSGITGMLQLIDKEQPELMKNPYLGLLTQASQQLHGTIDELAEVVRFQLGEEQREIVPISETLQTVLHTLAAVAHKEDVQLDNQVAPGFKVYGVPAYVSSVLLNLISNAIKYKNPAVPSWVRISAEVAEEMLVLTVEDNGLGMDLAQMGDKLFGLYNTFHRHHEARGIGLYITKGQIEVMGGRIEVASTLGEGTTFTVYLPAAK